MTEPNRPGAFETYPYHPGAPDDPAEPVHDPAPSGMVAPPAAPLVAGPVASGPQGVGRRGMLAGVAALAGMGAIGVFGLREFSGAESDPGAPELPLPVEPDTETVEETTFASLTVAYGELFLEVPAGWSVDSEGELLMVSHDHGRLAARAPEQAATTEAGLAREADYLREDFDPGTEALISDESDTRFTVLVQTTGGHLNGQAATEHVALLVNIDLEQAVVVSWVTVDGQRSVTVEARTMERQVRRGFEDL